MYKEQTAAQVVAYFLWKAKQPIAYIKIMKLMYFAEREFLLSHGSRLTGDELFSLPYGPVLSNTLDRFHIIDWDPYWSKWIECKAKNMFSLKKGDFTINSFDHLSDAAIKILDRVYEKYGGYEAFDLVDLTHTCEHCPEWQNPGKSRLPLKIEDILRNHGRDQQQTDAIMKSLREQDEYDKLIADLVS